jgi:nucleotide-binding universal stress UspA family protein
MIHFNTSRILIPVDFSETSLLAIKHGAFIAKESNAALYLLHVVGTHYVSQNMFLPSVTLDQGHIEQKATEKLAELAEEIKAEHQVDSNIVIKVGTPANEVSKVAREIGASLIVMGTHGYSPLEELVIGSVALKVITRAHCPVMAMSNVANHKGYSRIVIPIDTTVNSRQKVHFALEMGKKFNATVHALGLLASDEENEKPGMELILKQIKILAEEEGTSFKSDLALGVKNRATSTVNYAKSIGADLIIIMTDQDAELSGFFLGPYSQQVIHLSHVPVIAVKPEDLFVDDDDSLIPNTSGA